MVQSHVSTSVSMGMRLYTQHNQYQNEVLELLCTLSYHIMYIVGACVSWFPWFLWFEPVKPRIRRIPPCSSLVMLYTKLPAHAGLLNCFKCPRENGVVTVLLPGMTCTLLLASRPLLWNDQYGTTHRADRALLQKGLVDGAETVIDLDVCGCCVCACRCILCVCCVCACVCVLCAVWVEVYACVLVCRYVCGCSVLVV